ncbi:MAG TPA: PLP-dependent aminotransferase family protein [Candidatus Competibacteraceae bacterium]|nr:PLP-dependent aminotransferase family protein [Candidatus Competibacteraceae bacterium]
MSIWIPDLSAHPGPRYRALALAIEAAVKSGELSPGTKLPPHRILADALGVTVGTVARGYAEAERRHLVSAQVGSGTYVRAPAMPQASFRIAAEEREQDSVLDLSLSLVVPSPREHDLAALLRELADDRLALREALDYQPEGGPRRQRELAAHWLRARGVEADPARVLLCNGGQHGITLALQALTRPGDLVCAEGLSYPGFIAAARQLHLRTLPAPIDEHGLLPEPLDALCRQYQPRLLYCMPGLHNPTCVTTPEARRREIAAIAERHGLWLVEDDVQSGHGEPIAPPLAALAAQRTLHIHSAAKLLAGGLRVGFLTVPATLLERVRTVLRSHCWMAPPLMMEVASRWLASPRGQARLEWQRQELRARQALAAEYLTGYDYRAHAEGFNLWLLLPEPWRSGPFVARLLSRGVRVQPAETFAVGRYPAPQAIRLCLSSAPSRERLAEGLAVIRATLAEEPALESAVF